MFSFDNIKDYFIGDLLKDEHDTLYHANILVVFYVIVLSLCLLLPLQILYLFISSVTQQVIGLISIGIFLGALILIKVRKSIKVVAHIMLIFSTFTFFINLFQYPAMGVINGVLLACNILFVFNLFEKRIGAIYAACHVITFVVYVVSIDMKIDIFHIQPIVQELPERIVSFCILFIMVVMLILHYQSAHKKSAIKLLNTLNALRISEEQRKKSQAVGHIGNWEFIVPTQESFMDEESYRIFGIIDSSISLPSALKGSIYSEDLEKFSLFVNPTPSKKFYDYEFKIRQPSGEERIIQVLGELQLDFNGAPYKMFGIIQDITERKLAEEEQRKLLEITSFQNNKLKNFTYIVSHNIRSHSSNITSLVDMLNKSKNEEEKVSIQKMLSSTAKNLEDTLLNLNEIITISEKSSLPKHKLQLLPEVQKTLDALSASIISSTTKISVNIPESIYVHAFPSYLDSILLNLISNAIKYRFPDRFTEIEIFAERSEDYVTLSIKDNGLGINLEKNGHKVFGMYKTFHNNPNARGIGLFITKSHIEAMSGKIEVESQENIGSTFKVYFSEKD